MGKDTEITSFAAPDVPLPLTKAPFRSLRSTSEQYHRSPTQQKVDAYINSLKFEASQGGVRMRQRRVEQRGQQALMTAWHPKSSGLLLCIVAAALACVWWLSLPFN